MLPQMKAAGEWDRIELEIFERHDTRAAPLEGGGP
jgi:hypothetical protein